MPQYKDLFNDINLANNKIQLDEYVKRIISQKCVLSRILKATAWEQNFPAHAMIKSRKFTASGFA